MRAPRWLALASLVGIARCDSPPTELVVVIDSNILDLERVRLVVTRDNASAPIIDRWYPVAPLIDGGLALPGEVGLLAASGDDARLLRIAVTADVTGSALDFTLNFTARFRSGRISWVEVFLPDRCRDPLARECPFGEVCGLTSCEPQARVVTDTRPSADAGRDATSDLTSSPDASDVVDASPPMDASDIGEVSDIAAPMDASDARDAAMTVDASEVGDAMTSRDVPLCVDGRVPVVEVCYNGIDDNCDGRTDEGCAQRTCASTMAPGCGIAIVPFVVDGIEMGEIGTPSASPTVRVRTDSFLIDRYEVTIERFRAFWDAGHPAPPAHEVDYPSGSITLPSWPVDPPVAYIGTSDAAFPECTWANASASPQLPINCVSWTTAMAFCVWDGGRLPNEDERGTAARFGPASTLTGSSAPAGRRYPWGNDPPTCQANYAERSLSCGARPGGVWVVGTAQPAFWPLFDLSGNAQEWVADVYATYGTAPCWNGASYVNPLCFSVTGDPSAEERVVRGGSYSSLELGVRATSRDHSRPTNNGPNKGFRCVHIGA